MVTNILGIQGYGKQGMNKIEIFSLSIEDIRESLLRYELR